MFSIPPIDLSHGAYNSSGDIDALNVMMLSAFEEEQDNEDEDDDDKDLEEYLW
jgi:hypothetical protein